ncbi:hybrid sensor histidine kinase/response regulator [Lysobacter enzymogenes]|uniref:hybrid sensor histidine kinase/response regulator n=1 Tax=Lysobacter enzymogenes TaxID=69 RepID=UPI000898E40E|nr:hybrid sensor histidine kinase/response regulator [Lysobacter enzymogenes]SDX85474.1 two-component system, unclassified family, sensor histidine kinase and response regulator [Lysobacter enzymogenes]
MSTPATSTGRILVVDDQAANLRVVTALLSRQGYEVVAASTGDEALQLYAQSPPDLILLDVMMPGMDGFEVMDALRADSPLRVPVVFVTAAHDRDLLLRAFDAGVVDYVTKPFLPEELLARVNAHVGLKLTRDRLERVAREREELVNLVAHDLKNPLTSVLFASDLLINNGCKPERVPRYLQMIHESADDALGYIRHYLESQAGHRERAEHGACADLAETLDWLVRRYEMQLDARGIRVQVQPPANGSAQVAMDSRVLRQVSENLVTNAMKYAPGGDLTLAARNSAPGFWQLIVADRGPGIPVARQRELFKPFVRLHDNDIDDGLSSGLGLSLAKQIVVNAGGQLWYEERKHGGSRFIIELPEA